MITECKKITNSTIVLKKEIKYNKLKEQNRRILTKRRQLVQPACLSEVEIAGSNDLEELLGVGRNEQ